MLGGINFSITSFFFVFLVLVNYFSKERIKSLETKIYSIILITNLIGLAIEIISAILWLHYPGLTLIKNILLKLIIIYFTTWTFIFGFYVKNIGMDKNNDDNKKKIHNTKIIVIVLYLISVLIVVFLPLYRNYENGVITNTYGPSANAAYIINGIVILISFFSMIGNISKKFDKRYIPLIVFLFLGSIVICIQYLNPKLLLIATLQSFVSVLMYFTIENPDAKLVEYEKTEKERAEAASLAKSEFLSSMSHELRTPLNAIVGLSEDIESFNDKVPKEVKEDTVDIVNASNTLLEIIGSILDISKIESGKLDIVESDYAPKDEFDSIAKILRTKASEKNLEFNVSISERIPDVLFGDRLRIKQIINNLLSNAIKYTDHGRVNFFVNWLDASGALSITVSDTGRGVKPEDIDKLFSKYDRLGVEKTSNVQGTGLGLAITKTLIDLMGGTVEVKSEYLIGTTFSVTIPQKLGDAERLESIKMAQMYVPKDLDFSGKKLLVVDDNLLNIKVFKKAIKDLNFEVDECYNGQEALDKIELNNDYDIIFMDIKMPVMDGEEAIGHLINMPNFKTPVVALTADAMTGSNNKYINMGFSDYMSKPFSRKVIAVKLDTILNKGEVANKNLNTEEEKKEETQSEEVKES